MAKTVEDLVNLLNVIVDVSHPEVPDQGYETSLSRKWKDLSFATMDPRHWHLPESIQKPQPGALDQIVSTLKIFTKPNLL
jgi:Asp-tRNA(Asn)/Glu-tRNA(Gln) amidotransferase A subunit family amidase